MFEMNFLIWEENEEFQSIHLSAIMFFPGENDEERRLHWVLKNFLLMGGKYWSDHYREALKIGRSLELSLEVGNWLGKTIHNWGGWGGLCKSVLGGSGSLAPGQEITLPLRHGILCGLLLGKIIYSNGRRGVKTAAGSMKKTLKEINKMLPPERRISATNQQYIFQDLWLGFRSGAHLWWALLRLAMGGVPVFKFKGLGNCFAFDKFPGGVPGFLALAEHFRLEATQIYPPSGKQRPAILPEASWRVPKDYILPALSDIKVEL